LRREAADRLVTAGNVGQKGIEERRKAFRLTRRASLRAAVALGFARGVDLVPERVAAQTPVASPVANEEHAAASAPVRGGSIRIVRPGHSVENFNPAAFAQDPQIPLSYLEALVRPDPKTMRPLPWLANRWIWRNDGAELRLVLRNDVVWHDGTPFEAADAEFSYAVYRDDPESVVSGFFALVQSIEAVSEHELVIRFSDRDANWLFNAATLPIFSRRQYGEFWNGSGTERPSLSQFNWAETMPVGTGPWRVDSWEATAVQFSRFDDYWRELAWIDRLEISLEEGIRNRIEAWQKGDSQIAWPVRVGSDEERDDAPGVTVSAPAASVMFAAFNFANPNQPAGSLWTDLRVRQAVSLAIDRERYAAELFGGAIRWDAAGTVAQPWAHDGEIATPRLNREAAEVLLAEAGWIDYDGDGMREDANGVPLQPVAILRDDSRRELSAVMASVGRDLAEVGIDLTVEVLPAEIFDERWIRTRDYDLIGYAYDLLPGFTDYDLYGSAWDIRTNPAGWNPGGYSNAEADAAIAEFLSSVSIERQRTALSRLQRAVNDDLFAIWLGFPEDRIGVAAGIEGFEPDIAWQTAQTWLLWRAEGL
jgi:peptide/nickel transport system substrate-binding protein